MTKFSTKISKLDMNSGNPSAIGNIFVKEDSQHVEKLGTIFGIIELFSLPDDFNDKIFSIIADLQTEYYLPPFNLEDGLEKRLEDCLQRANRRLYRAIQDSPIRIEIGNINVLAGLIQREKIYLSQIGKTNAFLFHRKKRHDVTIVDIFGQTSEKKHKMNPEKMFSNIISGSLTGKDDIFLCNDSILEFRSLNELMETVTENTALAASKELERELEPQTETNNFYAIIIQPEEEFSETEAVPVPAEEPQKIRREVRPSVPSQKSINNLIRTERNTEKYLTPSMMPGWKKALLIFLDWLIKISNQAGAYGLKYARIVAINIAIQTKATWLKLKVKLDEKKLQRIKQEEAIIGQTKTELHSAEVNLEKAEQEEIEAEKEIKQELKETKAESDGFAKNFTKQSWSLAQTAVRKTIKIDPYKKMLPTHRSANQSGNGISASLSDWLNRQLAGFFSLSIFKRMMIIVAFAMFLGFSFSIATNGQGQNITQTADIQQLSAQIESLLNKAEAENVFNDDSSAQKSLAQAQELFSQISTDKKFASAKASLQKRIDNISAILQKVTNIDTPNLVVDLSTQNRSAQTLSLAKAGNLIINFDNQSHTLYKTDLQNKKTISSVLKIDSVKKIIALSGNSLILFDGNNNFYAYALDKDTLEKVITVDSTVTDFSNYETKLYALSTSTGRVYKYLPTTGGKYNAGSSWVNDQAILKNTTAISIDLGLFAIENNGQINHYTSGKKDETKFNPINPPLGPASEIYTRMESNYLYILDPQNSRVVVLDKNGNLKIQYTSKEFKNLKSMEVREMEKNIYVLSDNKVFAIPTNF